MPTTPQSLPPDQPLLREELRRFFNENAAPTGILYWNDGHPFDITDYDGRDDDRSVDQERFCEYYGRLAAGAAEVTGVENALTALDEVQRRAEAHREQGHVPIVLTNVRYNIPRRRFVARLTRHLREGQALAASETAPEEALQERRAFLVSALLHQTYGWIAPLPVVQYGLDVPFVLPVDCYLTNTDVRPEQVEIDFDDGAGWQSVSMDTPKTVNYPGPGEKYVRLRARVEGQELLAAFNLTIQEKLAPDKDDWWRTSVRPEDCKDILPEYLHTLADKTAYVGAQVWVFTSEKNQKKLKRPLILAEGFPGGYKIDAIWNMLNEPTNFAKDLLNAGVDLVILGFENGTLPIEFNALVVQKIINEVVAKVRANGVEPKLTVGGASMGGLVTRWALTSMEHQDVPHYTTRYFSIDTPHHGAIIPLGVQFFLQTFYDNGAGPGRTQIMSPAAQQMLLFIVPDCYGGWHWLADMRTKFHAHLTSIGEHPGKKVQVRKIGIANGVGNGQANSLPHSTLVLDWAAQCATGCSLYSSPGKLGERARAPRNLQAVTWMPGENKKWDFFKDDRLAKWESAPGGTSPFYNQVAEGLRKARYYPLLRETSPPCFVPTVSALAMKPDAGTDEGLFTNVSSGPFGTWLDSWTTSKTNSPHVSLDKDLAAFLLKELV